MPLARSQTIGQLPSGSMNVTLRDSKRRSCPMVLLAFFFTTQTPFSSGGQMNLCICNWNRTRSLSRVMHSTSSRRVIGV